MTSFDEKYGPATGGGSLVGKQARRFSDGAIGQIRMQSLHSVMVWCPERRKNLTFRQGHYEVLQEAEEAKS